jgi:hypothetical protein
MTSPKIQQEIIELALEKLKSTITNIQEGKNPPDVEDLRKLHQKIAEVEQREAKKELTQDQADAQIEKELDKIKKE